MRTELIRIGNSRGIRIPKPLIEQCRLGDKVEMNVEHGRLVISPQRSAREGWREAFQASVPSGADELLLGEAPNAFDDKEWKW